jgi:hypothetical protein
MVLLGAPYALGSYAAGGALNWGGRVGDRINE